MSSNLIMVIVGVVIILVAFGKVLYEMFEWDYFYPHGTVFVVVLLVIGITISLSGVALYNKENKMQGSYEIEEQYVIVYTEDTSVKYLIDPVTESVILVTPNGNVTLDETKEEFFESLKEKGYTEYGKKDIK